MDTLALKLAQYHVHLSLSFSVGVNSKGENLLKGKCPLKVGRPHFGSAIMSREINMKSRKLCDVEKMAESIIVV